MSENDSKFVNSPFSQLNPAAYPEKEIKPHKSQKGVIGENNEEEALFLEAMRNMRTSHVEEDGTGNFKLGDQCDLPTMSKNENKIKKFPPNPDKNQVESVDAEAAEFLQAMASAKPLTGKGRQVAPVVEVSETAKIAEPAFEELLEKDLNFSLIYSDEYLEGRVFGLEDVLMNRLREGQMSPEAHIDLHGLNSEQAFETLRNFFRGCWFKGMRVCLIVTGRGLNSPQGQGILRHKVQEWLTQEPFKRVVLAFCTAKPHDGGPGSIYVLLRKFRKKGKIYWDRMPADADLY